jgi:hypothetical protein
VFVEGKPIRFRKSFLTPTAVGGDPGGGNRSRREARSPADPELQPEAKRSTRTAVAVRQRLGSVWRHGQGQRTARHTSSRHDRQRRILLTLRLPAGPGPAPAVAASQPLGEPGRPTQGARRRVLVLLAGDHHRHAIPAGEGRVRHFDSAVQPMVVAVHRLFWLPLDRVKEALDRWAGASWMNLAEGRWGHYR